MNGFNIGEKVRLRKNLEDFKKYGNFVLYPSMRKRLEGKNLTIKQKTFGMYTLEEDNLGVSEEMLMPIEPRYLLETCAKNNYAICCKSINQFYKTILATDPSSVNCVQKYFYNICWCNSG